MTSVPSRHRELKRLARDASATAQINQLIQFSLAPHEMTMIEYFNALRVNGGGRWGGVLLCPKDGRRCEAHPTGGRCVYYCQRGKA